LGIRIIVFSEPSDIVAGTPSRPASLLMIGPSLALIALSLMTGLMPEFFYAPALRAIQALMGVG